MTLDVVDDASKTIFVANEIDMEEAMLVVKKRMWTLTTEWFMNSKTGARFSGYSICGASVKCYAFKLQRYTKICYNCFFSSLAYSSICNCKFNPFIITHRHYLCY